MKTLKPGYSFFMDDIPSSAAQAATALHRALYFTSKFLSFGSGSDASLLSVNVFFCHAALYFCT